MIKSYYTQYSMIPIRCINCSKVLADNYREFKNRVREQQSNNNNERIEYLNPKKHTDLSIQGKILNELGIKNSCCRSHYLTHVDNF
jgi:DNA-directed RNA polymerase subunit N (RpoN/RPB10)